MTAIVDALEVVLFFYILGDGIVAGKPGDGRGSGWNDPPASHYSSSSRGSLPRKRVPYISQANCTPSGYLIAELCIY